MLSSGVQTDTSAWMDKKPSEFPLVLPDLSSTIVVHGTGQVSAAGCERRLRRKRPPAAASATVGSNP